jgi:signal peptide peptidase SppA
MDQTRLGPRWLNKVFAILPDRIEQLAASFDAIMDAGYDLSSASGSPQRASMSKTVGVIPVLGPLSKRADWLTLLMGGTSMDWIERDFDSMVADPNVSAIVLEIDSPGGEFAGTPELAKKIASARGTKPIVAVANTLAASAAYFIASAADEVVVTPSGEVGSVGVVAVHEDRSAANEQDGVKRTYVTYGEHKAELNGDSPLTDDARAEVQRRVDEAGEMFVSAVAKNRGVTAKAVIANFGGGRVFGASDAVERKMADRIDTLEATITRLSTGKRGAPSRSRASFENLRFLG